MKILILFIAIAQNSYLQEFNTIRSKNHLPLVTIDTTLEKQAYQNNLIQVQRDMGHYYMGSSRFQCVAWNTNNPFPLWMNSASHRRYMLRPDIRFIGYSVTGRYHTLNMR